MTKYLILVRHSIPEMEADRPANTWSLSDEGRRRAERLAEQLKEFQPEVLVSSNEPKATETAEIVARLLQLEPRVVEGLHEHDRSNVPYLSAQVFHTSVHEFFQKPAELVFGSETADEAYARFYRAVHSVLSTHRGKTIVIVTHGTVLSLFVSRLTGVDATSLWRELGLPSFVAMDEGSGTVIVRNNII